MNIAIFWSVGSLIFFRMWSILKFLKDLYLGRKGVHIIKSYIFFTPMMQSSATKSIMWKETTDGNKKEWWAYIYQWSWYYTPLWLFDMKFQAIHYTKPESLYESILNFLRCSLSSALKYKVCETLKSIKSKSRRGTFVPTVRNK